MDKTLEDRATEDLIRLMKFYRDSLKLMEKQALTGLHEAQFRLLFQLHLVQMMPMSGLGKNLYISKSHMTTLVDSLIKDGLVERHPDPYDRRVINVSITEEGRRKLSSIEELVRKELKKVISGLSTPHLQVLCSSSEQMLEILAKIH